jgi:hypothetical protein
LILAGLRRSVRAKDFSSYDVRIEWQPALIFRQSRGIDGGDRSGRLRTIDETSLFCFQRAALYRADCVERKEVIMVRFVRLLAGAALAAGLAAAPSANAQTGPQDEGAVQTTGPLGAPPQKPRQTALKKRAKRPAPAGRQITVHARPSYLTAGTQVPVGTVGNGYVYGTFNQPTPIEGTFMGMRGRERLTDPLGNAAPGFTLFRF